ncbi:hypothetical protein GOBAR_DD00275 [Gossypium barbadense]|nr:hypothetical protein GOBAR_DD00275 [Gossypium barbadense]
MDGDVTPVVVEGVPSITAIVQTIGPVVKLDVDTGYVRKGHFARLMLCVDLRRQLISKVRVNGRLQRVEYELLPNICFKYGHYGHGSESCMGVQSALLEKEAVNFNRVVENIRFQKSMEEEPFVPWMVVGWRTRRGRFTGELRTMVRTTLMVTRDLLRLERLMEINKILIQGTKNQTKENRMRQQVKGKGLLIGIGPKAISKALRPNNGKMRLHDSVELRTVMKGLVREFERVPKKAPMEDDTSFIKEVMVIEDACNDEVNV